MIDDFSCLTLEDKYFILENLNLFNQSTRSKVRFLEREWREEIDKRLDKVAKLGIDNNKKNILSKLNPEYFSDLRNQGLDDLNIELTNLNGTLLTYTTFETKENIRDFLYTFHHEIEKIYEKYDNITEVLIREYLFIFTDIIPYKIRAYEISEKSKRAEFMQMDQFLTHELSFLFSQFVNDENPLICALYTYYICTILGLYDEENKNKPSNEIFAVAKRYIGEKYFNISKFIEFSNKLKNGDIDVISLIDQIKVDADDFPRNELIEHGRKKFIESYEKNKIATKLYNDFLIIGDNILPDDMSLDRLLVEIKMVNEEMIKDYIGGDNIIDFCISENNIGFLKSKLKYPICKVMSKEFGFFTITKKDGISYILFNLVGKDSRLYGISFPSELHGNRKVIVIGLPTDSKFKLSL